MAPLLGALVISGGVFTLRALLCVCLLLDVRLVGEAAMERLFRDVIRSCVGPPFPAALMVFRGPYVRVHTRSRGGFIFRGFARKIVILFFPQTHTHTLSVGAGAQVVVKYSLCATAMATWGLSSLVPADTLL